MGVDGTAHGECEGQLNEGVGVVDVDDDFSWC